MKGLYFISICLILFSCKKETTKKQLDYILTYEVITSSGTWFGEYTDSTGERVSTTYTMPSGWTYTFKLKSMPFEMFTGATSTCLCPDLANSPGVTINFYSNGTLFKTEKNN